MGPMQEKTMEINETIRYNTHLRSVSFGFSSFSSGGSSGNGWIILHGAQGECELVFEGAADLLEDGGLRNMLDHLEKTRGIVITSCCIIGIPYSAGVEARIRVRQMCQASGLGEPLRIMRTPSILAAGYGFQKTVGSLSDHSNVIFIRVEETEAELSLLQYYEGLMEIICSERKKYDSDLYRTLLLMLKRNMELLVGRTNIREEGNPWNWTWKIVLENGNYVHVEELKDILESASIAITGTEVWNSSRLLEAGCQAVTFKLTGNRDAADFLLLDITTLGYRVCRADNGECLLEVFPNSTIPLMRTNLVDAGARLEIYENNHLVGIMNRPAFYAAEEKLSIHIDTDGHVSWGRTRG